MIKLKEEYQHKPSRDVLDGYSRNVRLLCDQWPRIECRNGILYRRWYNTGGKTDTWQIILPRSMVNDVILSVHQGYGNSHLGIRKTRAKVQKRFYWCGWNQQIKIALRSCDRCARYHRGKLKRQTGLHPTNIGDVWQRIFIDITGPHPISREGKKYILTGQDAFSKFCFAIPIRNREAGTVAKMLAERVFTILGVPDEIMSDNGPEFEGKLMKDLCDLLQIRKIHSTVYHPQSSGLIERWHRTLNSIIAKITAENQRDWDTMVPIEQ